MPNDKDTSLTDSEPQLARVAFKAPPFWHDDPELWFQHVESQFVMADIKTDATKFHAVIATLDCKILRSVRDIIQTPPSSQAYDKLKERVLEVYSQSESSRLRGLLQDCELGDRKPTQLLHEMRNLAGKHISDDVLRTLWLQRLPANVQQILHVSSDSLDGLAKIADKVCEVSNPIAEITSTSAHSEIPLLAKRIEDLEKAIHRLSVRSPHRNRFKSPRRVNSRSSSRNSHKQTDTVRKCWYHFRFGKNARKCSAPCAWSENP